MDIILDVDYQRGVRTNLFEDYDAFLVQLVQEVILEK